MDIDTVLLLVSTVTLVIGVVFGIVQLRQYEHRRRRESMLELVHSFQTPSLAKAWEVLFRMPEGLSRREVESWVGEDASSVFLLLNTWESLGILVHRGELDLDVVDDFFSGPIVVTWRKLGRFVEELRRDERRETFAEWAQWLAERMLERESREPPVPAHVAHRAWEPRD